MELNVIYKISSPIGKVYIGRTKNFNARMAEHKYNALVKKSMYPIHKAIRKYGWDNMKKEILCEVEESKCQKLEEEFILAYDSVKRGYNGTYVGAGGDLWIGRRDDDSYKNWIERMKIVNSSNRMHGKSHSSEARQKQKEKAKGRFSLQWYIDRNGIDEGTRLYKERCEHLKNRKLHKDESGRFAKSNDQ